MVRSKLQPDLEAGLVSMGPLHFDAAIDLPRWLEAAVAAPHDPPIASCFDRRVQHRAGRKRNSNCRRSFVAKLSERYPLMPTDQTHDLSHPVPASFTTRSHHSVQATCHTVWWHNVSEVQRVAPDHAINARSPIAIGLRSGGVTRFRLIENQRTASLL